MTGPDAPLLRLHRRLGPWLFSKAVCWKAPYFASIAPRVQVLEAGRCVASFRHRRRVTNHLGTVHAIALCNAAELVAGLALDAAMPAGMRWIPRGMRVEYLHKAIGTMTATAEVPAAPAMAPAGYELPVQVVLRDPRGVEVFRAEIAMWVTPRPTR